MSDEIKQEPVDNQPAKELSTDELGEVTGGCIASLFVSAVVKPKAEEPPQGGQNDPAQMFQQILQQLTQGQG